MEDGREEGEERAGGGERRGARDDGGVGGLYEIRIGPVVAPSTSEASVEMRVGFEGAARVGALTMRDENPGRGRAVPANPFLPPCCSDEDVPLFDAAPHAWT